LPVSVLQRIEVSSDHRGSPLGGPRALSWGFAALRGYGPIGPGRSLVPPDPHGVSTPNGYSSDRPPTAEAVGTPHTLSYPFRGPSQESCAVPPTRPPLAGRTTARRTALPLLDFLALRHDLGTADPMSTTADPSAVSWRVRGLATPIAPYTTVPTGARSAGAPIGFALQGLDPHRGGTPLGASALLTFRASCRRSLAGPERTTSPARRCSRDGSLDSDPVKGRTEQPSWASPLQRSLPDRPGSRL